MDTFAFVILSASFSFSSAFSTFQKNIRKNAFPQDEPSTKASAAAIVNLGTTEAVQSLFSYPNHYCPSVQEKSPTLEETVAHYLNSSIKRDGFSSSSSVTVSISENEENNRQSYVYAEIHGDAAPLYQELLPSFLKTGYQALEGCQQLSKDQKWLYYWRFFLPLGLAMTRHFTLELMHFPPDYTLGQDQDYLAARTTKRWKSLLELNHEEANNDDLHYFDRYQTILDIVPIAAPSRDGKLFAQAYGYFHEYTMELLKLWVLRRGNNAPPRPIVAFGWPVRQWIQATFLDDNRSTDVLDVVTISIEDVQVPVIIANHPSRFYTYAEKNEAPSPELLRTILIQDLIVARWQVQMVQRTSSDSSSIHDYLAIDPQQVLEDARMYWESPLQETKIQQLLQSVAISVPVPQMQNKYDGLC